MIPYVQYKMTITMYHQDWSEQSHSVYGDLKSMKRIFKDEANKLEKTWWHLVYNFKWDKLTDTIVMKRTYRYCFIAQSISIEKILLY